LLITAIARKCSCFFRDETFLGISKGSLSLFAQIDS